MPRPFKRLITLAGSGRDFNTHPAENPLFLRASGISPPPGRSLPAPLPNRVRKQGPFKGFGTMNARDEQGGAPDTHLEPPETITPSSPSAPFAGPLGRTCGFPLIRDRS
jgi:hypothetical protein